MKNLITCLWVIAAFLPLELVAQQNLSGIWRLQNKNVLSGPDYANAIPIILSIEQRADSILMEMTLSIDSYDTTVREQFAYGNAQKNITSRGKLRSVTITWDEKDQRWIKQTMIYLSDTSAKHQSVDRQIFGLLSDTTLIFSRNYDGGDGSNDNENFTIEGVYERVTAQQLSHESAKGNGVQFIQGLSWEQIKTKARKENKQIFVDCYATWCGPCKIMDRDVYPLNIVGEVLNGQFISVKVQMDSTQNDPAAVRLLYPLARELEQKYHITALPTYIFFSPEGDAVHKSIGQQNPKEFIKTVKDATNPNNQLYTLFNNAKRKRLPFSEYPALANRLKNEFRENELAVEVGRMYKDEYLDKLAERELFQKENVKFLAEYSMLISSKDKLFKLAFTNPDRADSLRGYKGWADGLVNRTIIREQVEPVFYEAEKLGKEPNWAKLEQQLAKCYNKELSITYTLDARVDWYERKQIWNSYFQYLKPHLARHDLNKMNARHLHYCAWYVFKYSNDTSLIKEAINWMDILIAKSSKDLLWMVMDTKAYLLYKMKRQNEAIAIVNRIREMFPQFDRNYRETLEKMQKGEKIWLTM